MKRSIVILFISFIVSCTPPTQPQSDVIEDRPDFSELSRVKDGKAVSVMLTSYSTTLLADGRDYASLRVAVTDSTGKEIMSASDSLFVYVTGDGKVTFPNGDELPVAVDTSNTEYGIAQLKNGIVELVFTAGTSPDKVRVEVKSPGKWAGSHEIHTIPQDIVMMKPSNDQLPATTKPIDRMIGADISFLPQMESRGVTFKENEEEIDALELLSSHGLNYIRLRVFVNPENEKGYSPEDGYCGLPYTLEMAKRVKEAGMKLLLNFHYSDYWADPQQQNKPKAWKDLDYEILKDSVTAYTTKVVKALQDQGTAADMIQVGNEINHGMLWPDGHIGNPDGLAGLLIAGVKGVTAVDRKVPIMMHIALGGQNKESVFWLDNMIARGVKFDIIGISYYPRWHGTLEDLHSNLNDLIQRYNKPINVVEYGNFTKEVHDIVFSLPDNMGKGACIWEPLGRRSGLFTRDMEVTSGISVYDSLNKSYIH